MAFRGQLLQSAVEAMLDAFPTRARLAQLLEFRLEKRLDELVTVSTGLRDALFELFQYANAEGWEVDLILAARASNPGNAKLMAFAEKVDAAVVAGPQLERWVRDTNAMLDLPRWLGRLGEIERRVCRIEAGTSFGTGFLIGPDLVLTNLHVVAEASPTSIAARFDYCRLAASASEGTLVAATRLVASSAIDDLDFALLHLSERVGELAIGANAEPAAARRGWLVPTTSSFSPDTPVFIVQHPRATPVSLALDTAGMIGVSEGGKRVRYRTNTEPGSSGSPCFDQEWNLIAMHRSGEEGFKPATFNEGIPITPIVERLQKAGIVLEVCPV